MRNNDHLIGTSRIVVRTGIVVNRLFLLAVSVALLLSCVFASTFSNLLMQSTPGIDAASELLGMRCEMLIGIVMAVATDRLLVALAEMIESARAGDPFVASNARRLQTVGGALLALQLLDLPVAVLSRYYPNLASAPNGDVSVGGWIAVLMVFVLSRIFAAGSVMRDELAGTI